MKIFTTVFFNLYQICFSPVQKHKFFSVEWKEACRELYKSNSCFIFELDFFFGLCKYFVCVRQIMVHIVEDNRKRLRAIHFLLPLPLCVVCCNQFTTMPDYCLLLLFVAALSVSLFLPLLLVKLCSQG